MTRKIISVLLLIVICVSVSSCAGSKPDASTIDIYKLGAELSEAVGFENSMKMSTDSASSFFDLSSGAMAEGYFEVDDGLSVNTVFIAKTSDTAAAELLQKSMQTYVDSQKKQYETYLPEEYAKIKDTVVKVYDTIVYYAVGKSNDSINSIFDRYFK